MKQRTRQILRILHIITWVIFIGLCIKTGAILYSSFVSLVLNPEGARNLYMGLDLSNLYGFDKGHYATIITFIILLSGWKAYLFYQVIKIFLKINFVHPFSNDVSLLVSGIGYSALGIGMLTLVANQYCDWLVKKGVDFPDLQAYLGGGGEFLLLGVILFVISVVYKRGIEIQTENELTV